jgi:hypothetical protein
VLGQVKVGFFQERRIILYGICEERKIKATNLNCAFSVMENKVGDEGANVA